MVTNTIHFHKQFFFFFFKKERIEGHWLCRKRRLGLSTLFLIKDGLRFVVFFNYFIYSNLVEDKRTCCVSPHACNHAPSPHIRCARGVCISNLITLDGPTTPHPRLHTTIKPDYKKRKKKSVILTWGRGLNHLCNTLRVL